MPNPGWSINASGQPSFVLITNNPMADPPRLGGRPPFFVAKHGTYIEWTYPATLAPFVASQLEKVK